MTQLSPHFSLKEMTVTTTGLSNTPTGQALANLNYTAQQMELVRSLLGKPIKVNSGYRSAAANKAVGGSTTSAHSYGLAVDFVCPAFGSTRAICEAIVKTGIKFDQLILEKPNSSTGGWVHIGFKQDGRGQRQQILTFTGSKYLTGLVRY